MVHWIDLEYCLYLLWNVQNCQSAIFKYILHISWRLVSLFWLHISITCSIQNFCRSILVNARDSCTKMSVPPCFRHCLQDLAARIQWSMDTFCTSCFLYGALLNISHEGAKVTLILAGSLFLSLSPLIFWWNTVKSVLVTTGDETECSRNWEFLLHQFYFFLCTILIVLVLGRLGEFRVKWFYTWQIKFYICHFVHLLNTPVVLSKSQTCLLTNLSLFSPIEIRVWQ